MIRDEEDLQKAHDILAQLLMDRELLPVIEPSVLRRLEMAAVAETLCWVLRHDHNTLFAARLKRIYDRLEAISGSPIQRAPAKFRLDGKRAD